MYVPGDKCDNGYDFCATILESSLLSRVSGSLDMRRLTSNSFSHLDCLAQKPSAGYRISQRRRRFTYFEKIPFQVEGIPWAMWIIVSEFLERRACVVS